MAITITPTACEWLKHKGNIVIVRQSPRFGCCGGGANVAVDFSPASPPGAPSV